ncbi:hypothetical protein AURDEDRAFT_183272 [Auricularia subglabra TFB-10046 SS5]|nr:hypothetical protein AURDEDRAFT_183272 [Auricularia subglabra TFB-10046 SS5]
MNQLPLELVSAVFRHLDLKGCIKASHMCSRWRQAALSDPVVWSTVRTNDVSIAEFEEILSRTGAAPVDIDLELSPDTEPHAVRILVQHMHHVRHLTLDVCLQYYDDTLAAAFCAPAPLLERFTLFASRRDDIVLPHRLFGGVAPALRALILSTARLPMRCPALSLVESLMIWLPDAPPDPPYSLSDVCPNLESLVLADLQYGVRYTLADTHILERLEINIATETIEVAEQLRALNHNRIPRIDVHQISDNSQTVGLILDSIAHDLDTVSLEKPSEPWARVSLTLCARGRTRVFPAIHAYSIQEAFEVPARLVNVSRFDVAHQTLFVLPPRIPAVRHLCIDLGDEGGDINYELLTQRLALERTPCLESLTFTGSAGPPRLPEMLALAIDLRGARLRRLSVAGVHFGEGQETAMSLLRRTCEVLEWTPSEIAA